MLDVFHKNRYTKSIVAVKWRGRPLEDDATKVQLLQEIESMPFRDPRKLDLLTRFMADKSCKWHTQVLKESGEEKVEEKGGQKGWCSRSAPN